jgi:hypothetical protein
MVTIVSATFSETVLCTCATSRSAAAANAARASSMQRSVYSASSAAYHPKHES